MRIVSLVPSWTETLIEAGVDVVGRTRFCLHPEARVSAIPAVGGTKDWEWDQVMALKPDGLIVDREENPKFMGEPNGIAILDTHVTRIEDVPKELHKLADGLQAQALVPVAKRWERIVKLGPILAWNGLSGFPGMIEWGLKPTQKVRQIEYVIWKKPWMAVAKDTFVGSMLAHCGFEPFLKTYPVKYPVVELNDAIKSETLLLFSSEPFPFVKISKTLAQLGYPYALVNGESFSWFGVRSLRFLECVHGITPRR